MTPENPPTSAFQGLESQVSTMMLGKKEERSPSPPPSLSQPPPPPPLSGLGTRSGKLHNHPNAIKIMANDSSIFTVKLLNEAVLSCRHKLSDYIQQSGHRTLNCCKIATKLVRVCAAGSQVAELQLPSLPRWLEEKPLWSHHSTGSRKEEGWAGL